MSIKEIESAKTTQLNATRVSVYTIHQYILTTTSNIFQINQQQQPCGTDKYENAHAQAVTIEFSKRQERELSTLRTFWRLKVCIYEKAR